MLTPPARGGNGRTDIGALEFILVIRSHKFYHIGKK